MVDTKGPQMTAVSCWIIKAICTYAHGHAYAPEYPHALARATMHTQTNM